MRFRSFLLATAVSLAAAAQDASSPETSGLAGQNQPNAAGNGQAFADPSQLFGGQAGAFLGLGVNRIQGEGLYAATIINTEFNLGPVGLGLSLPLNLLVWNDDTCCDGKTTREDKAYGGIVRRRDWDEPQDYTKFLRFIRYGHKRDPVYFLAGQLWGASIGHGTLVNRYSNSLNLDHPKAGLALDVNTDWFGFETLTDYVADPSLLAGRVYLRPFGRETDILGRWSIGATMAADRNAPRALLRNPADGSLAQDDKGNPIVSVRDTVYAGGVDTEFEVLHNSIISLIPYVDLNRIVGAGNGLHAGILTDLYLPIPVLELNVQARLEYRMMQAGYIPEYFDQQYDLGRLQYAVSTPTGTAYTPKYDVAQSEHLAAADKGAVDRKGYYGELALGFAGVLQLGGLYQDYQGDPNGASLGLFATLPKFDIIKLSAYYLRKNMKSGFDDAFKLDERSLLAASMAYRMFGPVYLRADFSRKWQLQPGSDKIKAVDSFQAGIATFISF
jgi:hypothetical protein